MKFFGKLFIVVLFMSSVAQAKVSRDPASLPCDKKVIGQYMTDEISNYHRLGSKGEITPQNVQSLIRGLNASLEMHSIACGWTKIAPTQKTDVCTQQKADVIHWKQQLNDGFITQDNFDSLLRGQKEVFSKKCN
jgi:hypothetical protein